MIFRLWRGWTDLESADRYQTLLLEHILPGIDGAAGYSGAYVLRREAGPEIEFVTIMRFESIEAVHAFAGDDYEVAVVPPEAQAVLSHWEKRSKHYGLLAWRTGTE